jgi:release factor glutamine methyltransferase
VLAVVGRLRAAGCVFAEDEARLLTAEAKTPADLETMIQRRVAGEPLEYILGWARFYGLRIAVQPGVFVPRRRTEFVAREAISLAGQSAVVVDLCCGSGAIGAAIAARVPDAQLYAADIDPVAVRCARLNLGAARVFEGDLFDPLPPSLRHRIEVLPANVPYVPTDSIATMPPEARDHEPRRALDGGRDGLDILRRVAMQAPHWLAPGGHILIETSEEQSPRALEVLVGEGLAGRVINNADLGATVVIGTRNPSP